MCEKLKSECPEGPPKNHEEPPKKPEERHEEHEENEGKCIFCFIRMYIFCACV